MTLEELKIVISAETAGLQSQLNNVQSQVSGMTKSVAKSSGVLSKLFKGISVAAIVTGLIKVGKAAVSAASDLEEVQNVVDVAFGSMASEVQTFADNAIYQFGISELQAKQLASTFKAMSNSIGLPQETAKEMALTMTGLAADMSSFYNVSLETAQTALEGVFTGQTRALKQYGIVLTEASLEEYRLAQGIKVSYSNMTEAQKVQLRYSYVLKATANAQGDYARTSKSWANQVRLLANQWEQLKVELGSIVIAVIKPLLIAFNELLAKVVVVSKALRQAFGIKTETTNIADSAEDTAAAYESADKAASNLKATLAGFDELETLDSNNTTTGATGTLDLATSATSASEISDATQQYDGFAKKIVEVFSIVKEKFQEFKSIASPIFETIKSAAKDIWNNALSPLWESLKGFFDKLLPLFDALQPYIQTIIEVVSVAVQTVISIASHLIDVASETISHIIEVLNGLTDFIAGVFTGDWSRAWKGLVNIFKGIINLLITAFESFINIIPSGINGLIKGINSIIGRIGSKIGLNISIPEMTKLTLPRLASGGVIDSPTVAMLGEYAGASNNKEIVTPQSILKETINESNANLANVFSQMTRQIITSIESKDMVVYLDGTTIAKSVANANNSYRKMTGTPLLV